MIKTVFRGSRALCEIVYANRQQLKQLVAQQLEGPLLPSEMIQVECEPFGDLGDAGGNRWTYDITAPYTQARADKASEIAGPVAAFITSLLSGDKIGGVRPGDEIGVVRFELPFMVVAHSHGPLTPLGGRPIA